MAGIAILAIAYIVSHFYRAFLAVLSPALITDLGMTPAQLSDALGAWFLAFALSQFLVGVMLDRVGPRWTTAVLFAGFAGGGGLLFANAQSATGINVAMVLLGIGCAPVLMASVYIFKRSFDARKFAILTSSFVGIGLLGNVIGTSPLAYATEAFGWRWVMVAFSGITVVIGALIVLLVNDPPKIERSAATKGGYLDILKLRYLWFILPLIFFNYSVSAGLRGVWAGPYLDIVHGLSVTQIGAATFWMAIAMAAGSFAYGQLDRMFSSRKAVVTVGGVVVLGATVIWALNPAISSISVTVLLSVIGFCSLYYGLTMAQATAKIPDHLAGRGVTLVNFFNMAGVGVMQWVTAGVYRGTSSEVAPAQGFHAVLWVYAGCFGVAMAVYLFSEDAKSDHTGK